MKFLVCQRMEVEPEGEWAMDGEPVIPNFPTGAVDTFLGVQQHRPAYYARVAELPDFDLELEVKRLKSYYTGLPESMLLAYLLETAVCAAQFQVGTILQIRISEERAEIYLRGEPETNYTLWDRQPIYGML
jgi:hypothetical protein